MIRLSNGHQFSYIAASGALAFDGRGWPWEWPLRWIGLLDPLCFTIVTKTLTRHPRKGTLRWWNPFGCVRFVSGGTVNAVGLTNPGIDWWCRQVGPQIGASGLALVGSITDDDPETVGAMAAMLDPFPLNAIEINASCPNTQAEMMRNAEFVVASVSAVKSATRHPIILKLSFQQEYVRIAKSCEGLVEALAINSVPWAMVYGNRASPLARLGGGGVSGQAAQPQTWKMVQELAAATTIPVIGPSVWEFADIEKLRQLGASAISFGAIFLRYPWRPTSYVRRDRALLPR
ncbi:MAG: tRNA-dihydrouridine synthase [Deltaproteobacteria bacterium]|nr:tRNA-dihydrouridine synthase [Deltaproteobacteria bacterium]